MYLVKNCDIFLLVFFSRVYFCCYVILFIIFFQIANEKSIFKHRILLIKMSDVKSEEFVKEPGEYILFCNSIFDSQNQPKTFTIGKFIFKLL